LEKKLRILLTGKNYCQGLNDRDPSSLLGTAQFIGFEVVDSIADQPDVLICVDFERKALPLIRESKRCGVKTVLVVNEPRVVIPQHEQSRIRNKFDLVIDVGRPWAEPKLKWPQTWRPVSENSSRLERAVLVNADKWSFVYGQHYWLRAAAASKLEKIDVFGFGWERPLFVRLAHRIFELGRTVFSGALPNFQGVTDVLATPKFYKGSASDKISAMSNYKVALVVENSSEVLTEKLFDAWFAGCIPVYLGPPVEAFGIPRHLCVAVEEPTLNGVQEALDKALEADRVFFVRNLNEYLGSQSAMSWKADVALKAVLDTSIATDK
jgi:hypothetical protein